MIHNIRHNIIHNVTHDIHNIIHKIRYIREDITIYKDEIVFKIL